MADVKTNNIQWPITRAPAAPPSLFSIEKKRSSENRVELAFGITYQEEIHGSKMCLSAAGKETADYLKTFIENGSYAGVGKLTLMGGSLHDSDTRLSIPNYCRFSSQRIKLHLVDISESALVPLSSHLPAVEILVFNNCRFKPSITEPAGTDININMVETEVDTCIISSVVDHTSYPTYFEKIIQPQLFMVIQTETPSARKYYRNVEEKDRRDNENTTIKLTEADFQKFAHMAHDSKEVSIIRIRVKSLKKFMLKTTKDTHHLVEIEYP